MAWVIGHSVDLVIDYAVGPTLYIDGVTQTSFMASIANMGCEKLLTEKKSSVLVFYKMHVSLGGLMIFSLHVT